MTMKKLERKTLVLAAAAAGVAIGGAFVRLPSAMAQYAVGSAGHANDANNRVGSGGYNTPSPPSQLVTGNQVVTGNVTGGRQFRGPIGYTDPTAFRGTLAGTTTDNFVRNSAGTPIGAYNNNNTQGALAYYGQSNGAPPPVGFSSAVTPNGQYLPNLPIANSPASTAGFNVAYQDYATQQLRNGQAVLPGPTDSSNQATVLTASPLYGVRQWNLGSENDQRFLNNYVDPSVLRNGTSLDAASIAKLRSELQTNQPISTDAVGQPINSPGPNSTNGTVPNNGVEKPGLNTPKAYDPTAPINNAVPQAPADSNAKPQQPIDAAAPGAQVSSNTLGEIGIRNKVLGQLPPKSRVSIAANSPAYQDLQRRLAVYNKNNPITEEQDASRTFDEQRRAIAAGKQGTANNDIKANKPGQPLMPGNPSNGKPPMIPNASQAGGANPAPQPGGKSTDDKSANATPGAPANERPLMVNSFVRDLKPSGVTSFMTDAEKLMKDGKFTSALDKYDRVDQVAPNDPLVFLGRATAELGASYYSRADAHLRDAFTRNPALLMGQYDLRVLLGEERLNYLVKDLKDIAKNEAKSPRPAFLLSYIYYNVGDERRAAGYLDLAEKRGGGNDPFFKLIRQHWSLPSDTDANEMNK